jgi:hypothetical protein
MAVLLDPLRDSANRLLIEICLREGTLSTRYVTTGSSAGVCATRSARIRTLALRR